MRPQKTALLFLLFFVSFYLTAQVRDMKKEKIFENQLESIDPKMVDIFKNATIAMDKEDNPLADSLFSIVYRNAPNFDVAIRRLGLIKVKLGQVDSGLLLCEKAYKMNKTSDNILMYASSLLTAGDKEENLSKANDILMEGQKLPGGDDMEYPMLLAQIALKTNNLTEFEYQTGILMEKFPDEMSTHYFAAILAATQEKWIEADREIRKAGKLGLDEATVSDFLDSGIRGKARMAYFKSFSVYLLGIWIAGLVLLYLLGNLLSKITLLKIEKQSKKNSSRDGKFIRLVYKFIIDIAGVYYYISLPIILVLLIVLVIVIFYLFLLIGRIPIYLIIMLAIGAVVSIYSMIRSLFVKIKYTDPGRVLKEEEAPGLYALVREVAKKIGTRPVDEIRITTLTELAVYESGSKLEKMRNKAKRVLIVGTGILKDFKQNDFKAVIAHEYGHFSHRDTAGGEVALRVRNDMYKYIIALYQAGQTVWWNIAFQFLRLYDKIFRTISHGATRFQEVLADRLAAQTYGAGTFQDGLTYAVKRGLEFESFANYEIELAKKDNRPISNLYELTAGPEASVEEQFNTAMNRETTNDDTHPSPKDRFRYVEGMGNMVLNSSNNYVRDLFKDWNAITHEMTENIKERIKES